MRRYTIASPGFRQARAQGVTATYLEEGDEDEYEDEGLTPSERARSSLIRPQADAAAEVSSVVAGLCDESSRHGQMQPLECTGPLPSGSPHLRAGMQLHAPPDSCRNNLA